MTHKENTTVTQVERERVRVREKGGEIEIEKNTFKVLPGVSDAFNTYSHINGTLRQCNHGNRHQDYVKGKHKKDSKMLCLKQ